MHISSPTRSPESSHRLDYSYEGDTKSFDLEATLDQLIWPQHTPDPEEESRVGKPRSHSAEHCNKESPLKKSRAKSVDDIILEEGDESNEDDIVRQPHGTDSDEEDLPVIPKVPVKRRLLTEARAQERRTQRGKTKSCSPQVKKHKTPQIDANVITQLDFSRRPTNSVSVQNMFYSSFSLQSGSESCEPVAY